MKPDRHDMLENQISRELKSLGDLSAPSGLAGRVLATIEHRMRTPWYQRAWQTWPVAGQMAALAALAVLFAGVCYAGWYLVHGGSLDPVYAQLGGFTALAGVCWKTITVLGDSLVYVVRSLNPVIVTVLVAIVVLSYGLCAVLGTACVRLALVRR